MPSYRLPRGQMKGSVDAIIQTANQAVERECGCHLIDCSEDRCMVLSRGQMKGVWMEMQERCRNVLMSSRGLPDGNGWDCGRHHVNLPEEYGRECGRHHVNLPEEYGRECECHHVNLPEGDRRGMWMPAWF